MAREFRLVPASFPFEAFNLRHPRFSVAPRQMNNAKGLNIEMTKTVVITRSTADRCVLFFTYAYIHLYRVESALTTGVSLVRYNAVPHYVHDCVMQRNVYL